VHNFVKSGKGPTDRGIFIHRELPEYLLLGRIRTMIRAEKIDYLLMVAAYNTYLDTLLHSLDLVCNMHILTFPVSDWHLREYSASKTSYDLQKGNARQVFRNQQPSWVSIDTGTSSAGRRDAAWGRYPPPYSYQVAGPLV
jgi:hypothetical protein